MGWRTDPLADLHLHYGGCYRASTVLALAASRAVDLTPYEDAYLLAYGEPSPARGLIHRYRQGDLEAASTFAEVFRFGAEDGGCFDRFLAKFQLFNRASHLSDPATFSRLTPALAAEIDSAMADLATAFRATGVAHAELRVRLAQPRTLAARAAILDALLTACQTHSDARLDLRLAPSLQRSEPEATWPVVAEAALGHLGHHLTAIDFCHLEKGFPPKRAAAFVAELERFNRAHPERALALLYHVGESFDHLSLESAIRWCVEAAVDLGAHRLGHAIALGLDPAHFGPHERRETVAERRDQLAWDLDHAGSLANHGVAVEPAAIAAELAALADQPAEASTHHVYDAARLEAIVRRQRHACAMVAASGAVVEICPTSNRRIAGLTEPAHHQVHRLLECGVPVVVAADDPGLLDIDLRTEFTWLHEHAGLADPLLDSLVDRAWRCRSPLLCGRNQDRTRPQ